jgi:hypothetical protein
MERLAPDTGAGRRPDSDTRKFPRARGVWLQLRECESSNKYAENSGNGYYGVYQFSAVSWTDLGYPGQADLKSPSMQDQAAMHLQV